MFIEGVRLAEEALLSRVKCSEAFISASAFESERVAKILDKLRKLEVPLFELRERAARSLSDTSTGQGIVLLADRQRQPKLDQLPLQTEHGLPIIVFLEKVNNPANLGAIIRTAEAAGAAALLISDRSADPFSPKALRSSMGSAFRLPILTAVSLDNALAWSKRSGLMSIAADTAGTLSHTEIDWKIPRMLVLGSEAEGLAADVIRRMDEMTVIEMARGVESLNLSVACGILLFEARRQNGAAGRSSLSVPEAPAQDG